MSATAKIASADRRYRGKQSRPIPVWNGVLEHRARIDSAIWEFLWLLDGITDEKDGVGIVLGGAPVKASRIAKDLAFDERTVREHLETLEDGRYIKRRRTAYGYVFEVCNSRKFGIWQGHKRSEENARSQDKRSEEIPGQIGRNGPIRSGVLRTNKEDAAVTQQKDAASLQLRPAPNPRESVWDFLQISPCGPIPFRSLLEAGWESKNGHRASEVIGQTVDAWEDTQGEKPPGCSRLFAALEKLRQSERLQSQPIAERAAAIHKLTAEEIPA